MDTILKIRNKHRYPPQATLSDDIVNKFIESDQILAELVSKAEGKFIEYSQKFPEFLEMSETEVLEIVHTNVLNMYSKDASFPYLPLLAKGPWIISFFGGVIYDLGGYGMLGFGHNPSFLDEAIIKPQVMANYKTRSFAQYEFIKKIKGKIRNGKCPYTSFAYLNSGSESVTLAARVAEVNTKKLLFDTGKQQGKKIKYLSLEGGFHGRTERPSEASDSTLKTYKKYLSSFQDFDKLITVRPNDLEQLENIFQNCQNENIFIEAAFIEPVMGEGRAGYAITPKFYEVIRSETLNHKSILIIDSIQAGLRASGALSILDYPGFENLAEPDMETFSKALNAGQYPLSITAFNKRAEGIYQTGIYGNTMTGNPRALDIASAILDNFIEAVSNNIRERGYEFKMKLESLRNQYPTLIEEVLGTGLLVSCKLNSKISIEGQHGIELKLRKKGLSVIHGAGNRLRFTPWFNISSLEIDLVINLLREALDEFAL